MEAELARDLERALAAQDRAERTRRAIEAVLSLRRDAEIEGRVNAVAERCERLYGETPRDARDTARVVVWPRYPGGRLVLEVLAERPGRRSQGNPLREKLERLSEAREENE